MPTLAQISATVLLCSGLLAGCTGGDDGPRPEPRSLDVFQGSLGPEGGSIQSPSGELRISADANRLRQRYVLTYNMAYNEKGELLQRIGSQPEMPEDERLALRVERPESDVLRNRHFEEQHSLGDGVPSTCVREWPDLNGDGFVFTHQWWGSEGDFNKDVEQAINGDPRVRPNLALPRVAIHCASSLRSSVPKGDARLSQADYEPLLLVHGFITSGALGGFEDTSLARDEYFDRLPKLIEELDITGRRFVPFIFEWRSNSRFQDVAAELATALEQIRSATGKPAHIVAHSYGGLVTRTMMQGLGEPARDAAFVEQHVASVSTVGTPHSGVFDDVTTVQFDGGNNITFPGGRDSLFGASIEFCQSITCYQSGEDWPLLRAVNAEAIYGTRPQAGFVVYRLAETFAQLPNTPLQVLIGLLADEVECRKVENRDTCLLTYRMRQTDTRAGDSTIALRAQRLQPSLDLSPVFFDGIREEHVLGFRHKDFLRGQEDGHLAALADGDNIQLPEEIVVDTSGFSPDIERRSVEGYSAGYHHSGTQYDNDRRHGIDGFSIPGRYKLPQYTEMGMQNCSSATDCAHNTWHYLQSFLAAHSAQP